MINFHFAIGLRLKRVCTKLFLNFKILLGIKNLKVFLKNFLNITNIKSNKYHDKSNSPIEKYPFFIIFWVRVPKYLRCNFHIS